MTDSAISIRDLHHSYGSKRIYAALNLEIDTGGVFGLLGKNGVDSRVYPHADPLHYLVRYDDGASYRATLFDRQYRLLDTAEFL